MHEILLAVAKWLEATPWGTMTRSSLHGYPFVQLTHFTGLSIWLGTNFALDLRLLGVGSQRATAAQVAQELFVWNWIGFCIVLTGGFMLFSGLATSFIGNIAFQWKLGLFVPLALIWHIFVQRKARDWGQTTDTPRIAKFAALAEILLWICVVTAAVEIPNN
jgi:uncharacterized membrane-anchored protein